MANADPPIARITVGPMRQIGIGLWAGFAAGFALRTLITPWWLLLSGGFVAGFVAGGGL